MLNPELLARRDRAAKRHDLARERFPDRGGSTFAAELDAVIEELSSICGAIGGGESGAEVSRSFSWLGDAYFDRAQGRDRARLEKGRACYLRAEAALGPGDILQKAKVDYNFANTLRGLSEGTDVALLREAEKRYRRALEVFRKHQPNAVEAAETAVLSISQQLALAEKRDQIGEALGELEQISAMAKAGDAAAAAGALDKFKRDKPSTDAVAQGLTAEIQKMAAVLGMDPDHVADLIRQTQQQMAGAGLGASGQMSAVVDALAARLEADVKTGKVSGTRERLLFGVLAQMRDLLAEQPHEDPTAMAAWLDRWRDVMKRFLEVLKNPGVATRGGAPFELAARYRRLKTMVADEEIVPQRLGAETQATGQLFLELAQLRASIDAATDANQVLEIERERLRPLAERWRAYTLRHHLVLAWPDRWTGDAVGVDPSALVWLGNGTWRSAGVELCQSRGLRLFAAGHLDPASAAWTAARAAAVVVAELEGKRGPAWAKPCYELGLAACTGAPIILLMTPGQPPPFDLDVPPIVVREGIDLVAELSERIDAALFDRRSASATESTLAATLALARRTLAGGLGATLLAALRGDDERDPLRVRGVLVQAMGVDATRAPMLLTPSVPVPYPDPAHPSCFHVTPFDRPGTTPRFEAVCDVARAQCRSAGVEYLHGSESPDGRVLRSIWNDIGRSTHVLVDLTDFNPNVAFELGVAHALGRNVLAIGRSGTEQGLFPAIAKERVTTYDSTRPAAALGPTLARFLAPQER